MTLQVGWTLLHSVCDPESEESHEIWTAVKHHWRVPIALKWRHNGCDSVSNHQPHDCLLNRLFRRRSKKTSKPRVTGLCEENSPATGKFPSQMVSNAENFSIWWRHHGNPENKELTEHFWWKKALMECDYWNQSNCAFIDDMTTADINLFMVSYI